MIDSYLILAPGILILLFIIPSIGNHQELRHFTIGRSKQSINKGAIIVLSHTINGSAILLTAFAVVQYGFVGGIGVAITGLFVLFAYSIVTKKVISQRQYRAESHPIYSLIQSKVSRSSFFVVVFIMVVASLEGFMLQSVFLGMVFEHVFHISHFIVVPLAVFFSFVFAGLGGMNGMAKTTRFLLFVIFAAIVAIPLYVYLYDGVATIYHHNKHD